MSSKIHECQDLKNIQYKTMLLNGTTSDIAPQVNDNTNDIDKFLEKEKKQNKKVAWARLDRTQKLNKIFDFVDSYSVKNNLSVKENDELKNYLTVALDRKKLQKVSEIKYNKDTSIIDDIPVLIFNTINRKFTLKRSDKRSSTISSLGTGSSKTRRRPPHSNLKTKLNDKIDTNI
jgi:hypothetical protein